MSTERADPHPSFDEKLERCMLADRHRLESALRRIQGARTEDRGAALARVSAQIDASVARRDTRDSRLPQPSFDNQLPISALRHEIAAAIADNQVTIVCGETGSGKTTQIPKICLDIRRGVAGLIGHTQPRRIAARAIADRLSKELGAQLGAVVGYKVRFQDQIQQDAYIKVMTDGILLAETQADRFLQAYDTIIIDEAHERSLNIDFLLGYLRRLLPKRPELRLIITSATIDAPRFSEHFSGAPVIEVSGRLYPIEMRYRPAAQEENEGEDAITSGILDAVDEAGRVGSGHVLVFLPGEREIRHSAEALRKHHPPGTEVLPLYARLSASEQARVFEPTARRRIVLATNVAETSLTVPGIRFVIDPGYARINRYSYRAKVEQLLIEKIPQSSADQRAGRCGRVMGGVCFRLYSEDDLRARPAFADPEVMRSSLAAVILRMKALGIGDVESFPFIDPPQPRMINDGYQLLTELGAVDEDRRITGLGRELARLPADPRIGRMVLEAKRLGCLNEVLIIASALTVQDPRERPMEHAQSADDRHAPFLDEQSDFTALLKLWRFYDELLRHKKSGRRLAETLREHYLSPLRMREWREVHGQLAALIAESGAKLNEKAAGYETVHQALLTGLLGNIGVKNEEGEYNGARGIRFAIHPSSGVRKRQPRWVIAAELVETTRLFARVVARVEAEWIERAAGHLVKRAWLEPRWDPERAEVVAWEQISLYGIVLIARRRVAYGRIDSPHARDIFIRAGLVEGGYVSRGAFQAHNVGLKCEVEAMEHKARRHGVLVDDEAMVRFFDTRLPAQVCSGASFESWRKHAEASDPRVLFMSLSDLVRPGTADVAALYPDTVELDDMVLSLAYRFDPGHPFDGVTATIPLHQLNRARPEPLEWLVPGLLRDKINALVRALPKHLRRQCVPLPETVTACLTILDGVAHTTPLVTALKDALKRARDIDVDVDHWDDLELAPYLRMNFRIVDEAGDEIACGRDLAALKTQYGIDAQTQFASESRWERAGLRAWDDLTLPESVDFIRARERLTGYPALIDEGDSARLSLLDTAAHAERANRTGICRLARIALKDQVRALERMFVPSKAVALSYAPYGSTDELVESLLTATLLRAIWTDPHSIRDRAAYDARLKDVRARLQLVGQEYNRIAETILIEASAIRREIETISAQAYKFASQDLALQLKALVFPRFLVEVAYEHLQHYPRYLAAMRRRMQKLPNAPDRDEHHTHELGKLWQQMEARRARNRKLGTAEALLEEYRWMLEEQRVSLFAQELKTPYPVSYKRLDKLWAQLRSAT